MRGAQAGGAVAQQVLGGPPHRIDEVSASRSARVLACVASQSLGVGAGSSKVMVIQAARSALFLTMKLDVVWVADRGRGCWEQCR